MKINWEMVVAECTTH